MTLTITGKGVALFLVDVYAALTIASLAMYAFLGITWWVPMKHDPDVRELVLGLFYTLGFGACTAAVVRRVPS